MVLSKKDKDFYRKISLMRKRKVGGQHFKKDPELAKIAQTKSVEVRLANKKLKRL